MCGDAKSCVWCCKYVLIVGCCILHVLCGCALLGVGLYLCFEPNMRSYAVSSGDIQAYYIALYVLIGVGALMMIVGFLGCCGACAENRVLLTLFFIFILIICVIEIGGGLFAYFRREELKVIISDGMQEATKLYGTDPIVTEAFDKMHEELQCCGATGAADFLLNIGNTPFPQSCCKNKENACTAFNIFNAFGNGCVDELFKILENRTTLIGGLAIGIGVVQVLGMIFSCFLCCAIGREGRDKSYL